MKAPCLGCHEYDKSSIGGLIGAISISLDAGPELVVHQQDEQLVVDPYQHVAAGRVVWRLLLAAIAAQVGTVGTERCP